MAESLQQAKGRLIKRGLEKNQTRMPDAACSSLYDLHLASPAVTIDCRYVINDGPDDFVDSDIHDVTNLIGKARYGHFRESHIVFTVVNPGQLGLDVVFSLAVVFQCAVRRQENISRIVFYGEVLEFVFF